MASSTPSILVLGPSAFFTRLDTGEFTKDELGVATAIARWVCYPPNEGLCPSVGSSHPTYSGLLCTGVDYRVDTFGFITATYMGIMGSTHILHERSEWFELATPAFTTKVQTGVSALSGLPEYTTTHTDAVYLRRWTLTTRWVQGSQPNVGGVLENVSGVQRGGAWVCTKTYQYSEPLE